MAYRMGIVVACLLASMTVNVMAQENGFRLETDVFVQGNDKPVSRTVTLFHNGVAYDFPRDGQRVTMVDPSGNRIVIFDTQRSVQTVVDIKELAKLMETAKKQAPEFLTAIIAEADRVQSDSEKTVIGGEILSYTATHQSPPKQEYATSYAAFADALALLNAGREPAQLPYSRLKLNTTLRQKGLMPREVTKKVSIGSKPTVVRSIVHATWRLSSEHEDRIARVGEWLTKYNAVTQTDFFAPRIARP
ncbi:MAG: hypothetical protein Aurels2KO_11420 [Aureliella sp.]